MLVPAYDEWMETLVAEPCVAKQEGICRELLEAAQKLRKGMAPR